MVYIPLLICPFSVVTVERARETSYYSEQCLQLCRPWVTHAFLLPTHITFHWRKPNPFCQCKEHKRPWKHSPKTYPHCRSSPLGFRPVSELQDNLFAIWKPSLSSMAIWQSQPPPNAADTWLVSFVFLCLFGWLVLGFFFFFSFVCVCVIFCFVTKTYWKQGWHEEINNMEKIIKNNNTVTIPRSHNYTILKSKLTSIFLLRLCLGWDTRRLLISPCRVPCNYSSLTTVPQNVAPSTDSTALLFSFQQKEINLTRVSTAMHSSATTL